LSERALTLVILSRSSIPEESSEFQLTAPRVNRVQASCRARTRPGRSTPIERCLQMALLLARQRTEKSLELRAAMSLARFWGDQGRRAEARELLEPVHDWFTEGLDLPDLKKARTLLNDLGCST
jgi:predicted ATPase